MELVKSLAVLGATMVGVNYIMWLLSPLIMGTVLALMAIVWGSALVAELTYHPEEVSEDSESS